MLDKLRLTAKNSFIYSLGNISIRLTGLILIPLYTNPKYLSVADFGVLGILEITSLILISLIDMSLNFSLARWYWDTDYKERQKSMFFTVFISSFAMAGFSIFVLSVFRNDISELFFENRRYGELLRLMFIASAFEVISGVLLTLLKLQQKAGLFTVTNLTKLIINLSATVILITRFNKGLNSIYLGQIMGNMVFLVFLLRYSLANIKIRFEWAILKDMLNFSYPLLLASVAGNLINTFDRYSLNYLSTLDNVGIYNLGFKLSNTIKILLVTSIQMAVLPLLYKMMNEAGSGRFYSKYMTYFSLVTMFAIIGVSLFSHELISVFTVDPSYIESYKIVPVLTFSVFFVMLKDTSMIGLQIAKKTKIISIIIFIISGLSLGLNILLIPRLGIYGAALAALLTQAVYFGAIYYSAQRKYPILYELRKVLIIFFTGAMFACSCYLLNDLNLFLRVILKVLLLAGFPFILFLFKIYEPVEIERVKEFIKKWKNLQSLISNIKGFIQS